MAARHALLFPNVTPGKARSSFEKSPSWTVISWDFGSCAGIRIRRIPGPKIGSPKRVSRRRAFHESRRRTPEALTRMNRLIYFDYNATTPLDMEVREAMLPCLGEVWGNPSSLHQ